MLDASFDTVRCGLLNSFRHQHIIYDLKTLKWRRLIAAGGNIKRTIKFVGNIRALLV
jgi:hypothetical protein